MKGKASDVQTVSGPNPWAENKSPEMGMHACYFCKPHLYPAMPNWHTLCSRCGQLIYTPGHDDHLNNAMYVCGKCEHEIDVDLVTAPTPRASEEYVEDEG